MKNTIGIFALLLLIVSCNAPKETSEKKEILITGIDSTLRPGDDFFEYVNGKWLREVKIPESQPGVGSYSFLNYPQRKKLQGILDSVSKESHPKGSIEQLVGDFYAAGMDTAAIDARGFEPIKPILDKIDQIKNPADVLNFVAEQSQVGNRSLISMYIGIDQKQSDTYIAQLSQTGTNLPERGYYFRTDSNTVATQDAYKNYLASLLNLIGSSEEEAGKLAETVYSLEKQLAESHKTRIELRDVEGNYNKMAVAEIAKKHPNLNWPTLLSNLGVEVDTVIMRQPAYYDKLNDMLVSVSIDDWKTYLKALTVDSYSNYLSKPFADANFKFSQVFTGQSKQQPRSEEMAQAVDRLIGHALAQIYVKKYFPEEAKQRMLKLVDNLKTAFEARVDRLEWMSDSTKANAKEKLYAFTEKIGYPDKWRDYSGVEVSRDTYFENRQSAVKNAYEYNINKLGQPIDRTEWHTTPPTVTAYNNPTMNEIVFPAGILQSPYFTLDADDALNYGGIGMVIGHEITHSFDDMGARYDKDGNVKNWWTKEDFEKFKARTQQVIDQYDQFTVLDSVHVKGALTVGENTADIAGVAIAYDAFKLTPQGQDTTRIGGFTPDQRFFISIARIWRVKRRDEFLRTYVNTDPHSPAKWRVNGPLMNFTPFYEAFDVKPGNKMYKPEEERIVVW